MRHWLAMAITLSALSLATGQFLWPALAQPSRTGTPPGEPWWAPKSALGIRFVESKLRLRTPVGRDIAVGHVEGGSGSYMPNVGAGIFRGVGFRPMSGQSGPNEHTTATARVVYGSSGLAPGISEVRCYSSNHWMSNGYLNTGTHIPPVHDTTRVFNHSWIGGAAHAAEALRRIDFAVDRHDVIMVVGVNNGEKTPVPPLLASSYNAIAVGVSNANSSGGRTVFEGAGRSKPDIVGPANKTSFATPMVTAVVARLLQAADRMIEERQEKKAEGRSDKANEPNTPGEQDDETGAADDDADATDAAQAEVDLDRMAPARSETIKAVLLAGAAKPTKRAWKHTPEQPLDEHLGAGKVRFDHSLIILLSDEPAEGEDLKARGWDFNQLGPEGTTQYNLTVDQDMGEISIALVWHRRIDGRTAMDINTRQRRWLDTPRLADFDIKLTRIGDADDAGESLIAESRSKVDNVEHIYLKQLPLGNYRMEVNRLDALDEPWDYALAWRIEKPREEPEGGN